MTVQTTTYQKNPFRVEAVQVTAENMEAVAAWCGGQINTIFDRAKNTQKFYIQVDVVRPWSKRQTRGYVGDWILQAGSGFKVYQDAGFRKSFFRADMLEPCEASGSSDA